MINLIKNYILTKKSQFLLQKNQYVFDVDLKLTKPQIKKLISEIYGVQVLNVNTHRPPQKKKRFGRYGKTSSKINFKRAIITLKLGETIPLGNEALESTS